MEYKSNGYKTDLIFFVVMFLVAFSFDAMNVMVYSFQDLFASKALIITSLYMAATMGWAHQIIHYFSKGHMALLKFGSWFLLSMALLYVMRTQMFISPRDWLKEMIPHHSTAITTTTQLLKNNNLPQDSPIYNLAQSILSTQQKEIALMQVLLAMPK